MTHSSLDIDSQQLTGTSQNHLTTLSSGQQLHNQVSSHWQELQSAAKRAGFELAIASGFRSFERQLTIWNAKFTGIRPVYNRGDQVIDMTKLDDWQKVQAILEYSALPGASRHHWGTDLDFYDKAAVNSKYQLKLTPDEYLHAGPFSAATNWLHAHAHQHGFYFPYQGETLGVAHEPWHLSFFPLANQFYDFLDTEPKVLFDLILNEEVEGKSAILRNFEYIIDNYVLNVAKISE